MVSDSLDDLVSTSPLSVSMSWSVGTFGLRRVEDGDEDGSGDGDVADFADLASAFVEISCSFLHCCCCCWFCWLGFFFFFFFFLFLVALLLSDLAAVVVVVVFVDCPDECWCFFCSCRCWSSICAILELASWLVIFEADDVWLGLSLFVCSDDCVPPTRLARNSWASEPTRAKMSKRRCKWTSSSGFSPLVVPSESSMSRAYSTRDALDKEWRWCWRDDDDAAAVAAIGDGEIVKQKMPAFMLAASRHGWSAALVVCISPLSRTNVTLSIGP